MTTRFQKWIEILYGPFFRLIGFVYRIYRANSDRVTRLTTGKKISSLIQNGAVLLLVIWILIWLFASDESRLRLTEEVKESIGSFSSQINEK